MKEAFKELFPPGVKPVVRWRLAVFAALVVVFTHIAWACGWLDPLNLGGGFAYAADMKTAKSEVRNIKVEMLEQSLFDTKLKQCSAPKAEKHLYTLRIQELMAKHREASGYVYRLPECDEL